PGQASVLPVQNSCTSQLLAGATSRQSKVLGCFTSAGQAPLVPSQTSATSQVPTEARHTVFTGRTVSAGQVGFTPSQVSAAISQPPGTKARHTVAVLVFTASAGQAVLVPSQVSATSHTPWDARQTVPLGEMTLVGPVQNSAGSQPPVEALQI